MIVLRHTHNKAYRLGELNGVVLRLHYATFRLIPYFTHSQSFIPVTHVLSGDNLASLEHDKILTENGTDNGNDELTQGGQILNPSGGVKAACTAALELSSADEHLPELSLDPSCKYAGPSPHAPSST